MSRYLLDKGVIRRLSEAFIRLEVGLDLTVEQEQALEVFRHVVSYHTAFVTLATFNVLRRKMSGLPHAELVLALTEVLVPIKYARRWARRLREMSFSREDAKLITSATFGTDKVVGGTALGVDAIITFDKRMARRFGKGRLVRERLKKML